MIYANIFNDKVILNWDKEYYENSSFSYECFLDGNIIGETDRTFFEIRNLCEDTVYTITLKTVFADKKIFKENNITVRTTKYKQVIDVTKAPYFAKGDGVTDNTAILQQALNDCTPEQKIYIPKGVFLTGALDMHGDTELYLDEGAALQGSTDFEMYLPKQNARFEGTESACFRPLIRMGVMDNQKGNDCKNVIIRGKGTVSGGGKLLCENIIKYEKNRLKKYVKKMGESLKEYECENTIYGRARPFLIDVCNCENVVIDGITIKNGPTWNLHLVYSENITVSSCYFYSEGIWNGDGIDPDSCENVSIFNCEFCTHDDAIAVKSGKNPQGNIINRPTKNVRIFSCRGKNGIAIGSEVSGGIDGVYIWDCDFRNSYMGIHIKTTKKRGGYIRNVSVKDSILANIKACSALSFNDDGKEAGTFTEVENVVFENIRLIGKSTDGFGVTTEIIPIEIIGFSSKENYFKDFKLSDISMLNDGENVDMAIQNVTNIVIKGVR